jgi:hypothetical protein
MSKTYKRNKFSNENDYYRKKNNAVMSKQKRMKQIAGKREFLRVDLEQGKNRGDDD